MLLRAWHLEALAVLDGEQVLGVVTPREPNRIQATPILDSSARLDEARAALQSFPALVVTHARRFAAVLLPADLAPPAAPELAERVWSALSAADRELLTALSIQVSSGQVSGGRLALVGGAVRDALLGLAPIDLDIVLVGGDVESLARQSGLPFLFHPAYQNATLTLPDGRAADLVSARIECYGQAGASPLPHSGTLSQDVLRRDFSLNALALVIGEAAGGQTKPELHDPAGGLADLLNRELRPLYPDSLTDDASRLIRGARLSARLKLSASPQLLAQVSSALAVAAQTPRLDAELRLMLSEPRPSQVIKRLESWGAAALLPAGAPAVLAALDALPQRPGDAVYAAGFLSSMADQHVADQHVVGQHTWQDRLALGPRPAALLRRALDHEYVSPDSAEATLRGVLRPDAYIPLTGKDVLGLGVPAGPQVGKALAHLSGLRRAGRVSSREAEEAELLHYLATLPK
ncbi:CCA tRNA nucleotidyltransferase [Deinococcus detaillensis]|uniref:CCA tRNA nucleotidyltransferase n=2 Tax=Deinococcus detaillensis TaxID=2592048 RepID=A0A553V4G3_9DEIO|nr:CCA tRNA nucleotidyltransferase [Deinococcus detaillensis]